MRKRACDSCYRRKIQCDGSQPRCDWCRHHDLHCTFDRPISSKKRGKGKKNQSTHDAVGDRVEQLEVALARDIGTVRSRTHDIGSPHGSYGPSSSASTSANDWTAYGTPDSGSLASPPYQMSDRLLLADESPTRPGSPIAPSHGPVFGKLHFAGHHLGEISLHNGIPFLSAEGHRWIQSRTGDSTAFQALYASGPPWQTQRDIRPSLLNNTIINALCLGSAADLPDRKAVDECLFMYCANPFKRIFPAIDAVLFQQTIDLAYEFRPGPPSLELIAAKACVFSFLALMSLHHLYPTSMPPIDSDEFALKAQYLLLQVLQDTTITGLQTCFMLGLYHLFLGQLQKASVFHAIACRMMIMLGANTLIVPPLAHKQQELGAGADSSWRMKNQLRKLFWLCYWYDKEISLRTGQPPSINDDDCDLTLPPGYLDIKYVDDALEPSLLDDTAVPLLPGDVRLDIIKSRTCKLLYSARALRKSDAELIRDIRRLDDELEEWRMSVPPQFRPTLSLREAQAQTQPLLSQPRTMERVMIHFEYHHLVATIHEATGRCRSWSTQNSFEMEGVSSSLALAVEASRSTLSYLRAIVHSLMGEMFWMAVFYPISATLTIFCNIIHNPLNPQAGADLELLKSAPHLIREMRLRRLARDEMLHMKMVDDFVAELARLANRAIIKARLEYNCG